MRGRRAASETMGNRDSSVLTKEEVEEYAELTYLRKREVIR